MRRLAAIILVPLLLFNTIGYYLLFYGDLLAAKHEAEVFVWGHESLGDKLVSLTFPLRDGKPAATDLIFTDDDEFMYQGRMYDVVSSTREKGHIVFKCYTDGRETALNNDLCDKIDSDNDSPVRNHRNTSLLKEFLKDYTLQRPELFSMLPVLSMPFIPITAGLSQPFIYRSVVSPPPEFLAA